MNISFAQLVTRSMPEAFASRQVTSRQMVVDIMSKQLNIQPNNQKTNPVIRNMLPFLKRLG